MIYPLLTFSNSNQIHHIVNPIHNNNKTPTTTFRKLATHQSLTKKFQLSFHHFMPRFNLSTSHLFQCPRTLLKLKKTMDLTLTQDSIFQHPVFSKTHETATPTKMLRPPSIQHSPPYSLCRHRQLPHCAPPRRRQPQP